MKRWAASVVAVTLAAASCGAGDVGLDQGAIVVEAADGRLGPGSVLRIDG